MSLGHHLLERTIIHASTWLVFSSIIVDAPLLKKLYYDVNITCPFQIIFLKDKKERKMIRSQALWNLLKLLLLSVQGRTCMQALLWLFSPWHSSCWTPHEYTVPRFQEYSANVVFTKTMFSVTFCDEAILATSEKQICITTPYWPAASSPILASVWHTWSLQHLFPRNEDTCLMRLDCGKLGVILYASPKAEKEYSKFLQLHKALRKMIVTLSCPCHWLKEKFLQNHCIMKTYPNIPLLEDSQISNHPVCE